MAVDPDEQRTGISQWAFGGLPNHPHESAQLSPSMQGSEDRAVPPPTDISFWCGSQLPQAEFWRSLVERFAPHGPGGNSAISPPSASLSKVVNHPHVAAHVWVEKADG
jgi:hypothetical protein